MFAYIRGRLEYKNNDYIIVDANGIGYKIYTALSTIETLGPAGEEVRIFTYLHVREDAVSLYGFHTQEELGMFELLLSVTGVGPKAAISILSTVSPSKFGLAVITDDTKTLTRAQGVGNKVAQRIILELKDKIKKEQLSAAADIRMDAGFDRDEGSKSAEAISALMVLGYTQLEASRAVNSVFSEELGVEAIIKGALKALAKR